MVYDEIFPKDRRLDLVQTEWSEDWHGICGGFEYVAAYLTEHRLDFGALVDQAGLAIFFLQRHRVEVAMKAVLQDLGVEVPAHHRLRDLWKDVEVALRERDDATWHEVDRDHTELVRALDKVDPGSFAFRYPVMKSGEKVKRPPFIDLVALGRHVGHFTNYLPAAAEWVLETWE